MLPRSWRGTKVHSKGTGGTEGVLKEYSDGHLRVLGGLGIRGVLVGSARQCRETQRGIGCVALWQHDIRYSRGTHVTGVPIWYSQGYSTGQGLGRGVCSTRIRCGRDVQQHRAVHGTTACLVCARVSRHVLGF